MQQSVAGIDSDPMQVIADWLGKLDPETVAYITGRESFAKCGASDLLDNAGITVRHRIQDFQVNPQLEDLETCLGRLRGTKVRHLVAIGGGSVIDMAKLIACFLPFDPHPSQVLDGTATIPKDHRCIDIMAVPTTAGTGSEATCFSVLYRNGVKYSIEHPSMLPSRVLLAPRLTHAMCPYQTACSGFDALTQSIESLWAVASTEESRKHAIQALKLAWTHLEHAVNRPDEENRSVMLKASFLAGKAINISKTTAAHALSYALTSSYGIPHGHAVSVFLPQLVIFNDAVDDETCTHPCGAAHVKNMILMIREIVGATTANGVSKKLGEMMRNIGLRHINEMSLPIDSEAIKRISATVNPQRLKNNPKRLDASQLNLMVRQSFNTIEK